MPIMGSRSAPGLRDVDFQRFMLAANKRMVRQWMGELKYMVGTNPADLAYLYRWFGTSAGQDHFRNWAQKLGSMNGWRDSAGAHTAGKASDINYEYNGWCPVCAHHDGPPEVFRMVGEPGRDSAYVPAGKLYDRALRVFLPLHVSEPDDPNGAKYFARKYYRNHWDWQLPQLNQAPPSSTSKLPVDYVYRCYQTLNWAIMFYFNYAFDRLGVEKQDSDALDPAINRSTHGSALSDALVWERIASDIKGNYLPATSELLCEPAVVPAEAVVHFEAIQMRYPFEGRSTKLLRLALNATKAAEIVQAKHEQLIGSAVNAQLAADHKAGANALVYSGESRDPCRGVFNHSYEFILATAGLLDDVKQARCFGSFAEGQAGDMQHFDYGYAGRPY
jgi:hypothetical protein